MIDSIRLFIRRDELPKNYDMYFNETITSDDELTEHVYSVNFRNMNFRLSDAGLRIEGSLTKFIYGHNLGSITLDQIITAIKEIEYRMNIDVMSAKVNRLDIGENLFMKYPIREYCQLLSRAERLERKPYTNGVYFDNGSRTLAFYDKLAEMKKRKVFVDEWLQSQKVLRFEHRYKSNGSISKFLNVKKASLVDVLNNYNKFLDSWENYYFSIIKENEPIMFADEVFKKKGGVDEQIWILGVKALGGLQAYDRIIENGKARGCLNKYPNEASNLKAKGKKRMNSPIMTQTSNLINELNEKIKLVNCYNHDWSEFYQIQ